MADSTNSNVQAKNRESKWRTLWDKLNRSDNLKKWTRTILILFFLALLLWVARYWHVKDFGLYADDMTVYPMVMKMNFSEYFDLFTEHLLMLHPHGRPLSNGFAYTFTFLGRSDTFLDLYLIGFAVVSINTFLFYWLLRRLSNETFAMIGGIAYVLFSADTTQAFLTHTHEVHPSLTFLLLGFHCYLSGKRGLTYILGVLILFTYETSFFMLLAAPFLSLRWDKKLLKELIINAVIVFLIIGCVFVLRSYVGDFRSVEPGFQTLIITPLLHMIQGPVVAMGTYFYRPMLAIKEINIEIVVASLVGFLMLYFVMIRFMPDGWKWTSDFIHSIRASGKSSWKEIITKRRLPFDLPDEAKRMLKLFVLGCILLILAYPLTFTVRAYAISGRDTRVHVAAGIGAAMLWACIGWLCLALGERIGKRRFVVLLFSILFALLIGFGFVIQKDYADAWRYQQEFWTQITPLIPDAGENAVILVDPNVFRYVRQMDANTWNLPRVLDQIYTYPDDWENPPRVYRLNQDWDKYVVRQEGHFTLDRSSVTGPAPFNKTVPTTDVILISGKPGNLVRWEGPFELRGEVYQLYSNPDGVVDVEENILYDFLIIQ